MEKGTLPESKLRTCSSSSVPRTTELFNFLSLVAFLLLTYTTAESVYRLLHQPSSALAFALFPYADIVVLYHCLKVFERLGPDATPQKKHGLKVLIWLLAVALSLAVTWRQSPS